MGIVRMGPPTELLRKLKNEYGFSTFIETGTYHGKTALWAASEFERVVTIEYSKVLYEETSKILSGLENVDCIFGDSKSALREIIPKLKETTVFWLDSHWCGGESYGENYQCPLIEELFEINKSIMKHFLFIDDARLFTSPPPSPNRIDQWPSIDSVIQSLQSRQENYYIVIFEDVIIAVPKYAKESLAKYCQYVNTQVWRDLGSLGRRSKESEMRQGYGLLKEGISMLGLGILSHLKNVQRRKANKTFE